MSPSSPSLSEKITLTYTAPIATITLCNPASLNALTPDLYYHLAELMRQAGERADIYITLLTAKGRFFSAGADVKSARPPPPSSSSTTSSLSPSSLARKTYLQSLTPTLLHTTLTFAHHPNILITALNGPVLGLSAALVAHSDFIYCTPSTYLLTPFTSLGLLAEGGSSVAFVRRMGIAKANEALIMSRRLGCEELAGCGFVNKVFDAEGEEFQQVVRREIDERLGSHLNKESMVRVKGLIRRPGMGEVERAAVEELTGGVERWVGGGPQKEFGRMARGEKRHKL